MAQAPDSPSAVLTPLRHAPPHQMMRGSVLKPLGYFTSILSLLLPPPPPAPLSGISAIPPPSAGSEPPKGRLPSPLVQVAAGREGWTGKGPGAAWRSSSGTPASTCDPQGLFQEDLPRARWQIQTASCGPSGPEVRNLEKPHLGRRVELPCGLRGPQLGDRE